MAEEKQEINYIREIARMLGTTIAEIASWDRDTMHRVLYASLENYKTAERLSLKYMEALYQLAPNHEYFKDFPPEVLEALRVKLGMNLDIRNGEVLL